MELQNLFMQQQTLTGWEHPMSETDDGQRHVFFGKSGIPEHLNSDSLRKSCR
jgi:hypothetical protein